ncbi:MAG TPA: NUDIX hydrolase [Candidatus Woesebacteria bacterium]|nr:NUDIX hydrolase [Candidatus Woesebacteria bacterium]HNS64864.1 NUDIX hydrolase [Candidatus Woesebacteria bacterium]
MNEPNIGVPIFFTRNNQLLLGQRKNSFGSGLFGLPGGRVAPQETLEQCLIREAKEEVGISPIKFKSIGLVKEWQATHFFLHFIFVCTKWKGEIANLEPEKSENWQWYSLDSLPEDILSGHKAGIDMFLTNARQFQVVEI